MNAAAYLAMVVNYNNKLNMTMVVFLYILKPFLKLLDISTMALITTVIFWI